MRLAVLYNLLKEHSLNENDDLAPHVTLLIDEPENILKILPVLSADFKPFAGVIKHLSVYEFFPKRFIKTLELTD